MKNDARKGFFLGVATTLALCLLVNSLTTYFGKNSFYITKAKAIYSLLEDKYIDKIDKEKAFDGLYTGLVALSTDKYSRYIPASEYESFKKSTEGSYSGIGVKTSINQEDNSIYVHSIYENSPAKKAGLLVGDKIINVEGTAVSYDNYTECLELIGGKEGSSFKMTIDRNGEKLEKTLTREKISVPTVASNIINEKIGYLKIDAFEAVTYDQYKTELDKLKQSNISSLIIDLRNNPGGLLNIVSKIADDILPEGTITYTEDKNGNREYEKSKAGELELPLAVLVNENSASASELLTAAVKDTKKGTIIGKNTYGKGVVQSTYPFKDGSALKITTSKYYTPNGVCIDGVGVSPNIEVENPKDFEIPPLTSSHIEYDLENDTQLLTAVDFLEK